MGRAILLAEVVQMEYPHLFSSIRVGSLELANRLVIPPIATGLANSDGTISERLVAYWDVRAAGGWALLRSEATAVDPVGKALPFEPGVWDDKFIPGLRSLADLAHQHGTMMVIQLHHGGRQTISAFAGAQPVAPSPIPCPVMKETPRELAVEEIWAIVERFGDAAVRAREAGFDGVEVHGAHGYLIGQFMSTYANKREDIFGGSHENRLRFPIEIVKNIRRKVGPDFLVIFRISGEEKVTGGLVVEEAKVAARAAQEAGADAIDVSAGVYETINWFASPATFPPGYLLPIAAEVKRSVTVPVIAVGRLNDPILSERAIEEGKADLVGWGRQALADPQTPHKLAAGRLDDIVKCDACLEQCLPRILTGQPIACKANPLAGRELEVRTGAVADIRAA